MNRVLSWFYVARGRACRRSRAAQVTIAADEVSSEESRVATWWPRSRSPPRLLSCLLVVRAIVVAFCAHLRFGDTSVQVADVFPPLLLVFYLFLLVLVAGSVVFPSALLQRATRMPRHRTSLAKFSIFNPIWVKEAEFTKARNGGRAPRVGTDSCCLSLVLGLSVELRSAHMWSCGCVCAR